MRKFLPSQVKLGWFCDSLLQDADLEGFVYKIIIYLIENGNSWETVITPELITTATVYRDIAICKNEFLNKVGETYKVTEKFIEMASEFQIVSLEELELAAALLEKMPTPRNFKTDKELLSQYGVVLKYNSWASERNKEKFSTFYDTIYVNAEQLCQQVAVFHSPDCDSKKGTTGRPMNSYLNETTYPTVSQAVRMLAEKIKMQREKEAAESLSLKRFINDTYKL